jgi:hypothetical protein
VLESGQRVPETTVWTTPQERRTIRELLDGRPALFLFYLFDWSAT